MKAVIYCRVSTKEQVQNLSLSTQLKVCREYCAREGFHVAEVFTDAGESAKTTDRPEFQKLIAFCRKHKRDLHAVVVYNLTRFSRNALDYSVVRGVLQGLGISVRSANEPIGDDPTGALMGNMLAAFAQFDNDEKARRTKAGMKDALELGRWTFQAPLGYQKKQGEKGQLIPDPVRAPLIQLAFDEYGTGRFSKTEVLRRLTALGLTTHAGKALTAQTLGNLLRNSIYAGWLKVPALKVTARGDFVALVPEVLFRRVQTLLDGKGHPLRPHARNHQDFPLRRFVSCARCTTPLTGSWSTGRSKKFAYYHCRKCRRVKAKKLRLEVLFTDLLERLKPEPGYLRLFKAIILDVWKSRQADAGRLRATLENVVRDKRQKLDRLDEAFVYERSVDRQTYERQRDQLREQVALAEVELNQAVIDHLDVEGVLRFAEHLVDNAARLWMQLGLDQKQQLQRVLFPEGLRFDGEKFGTAVTCLAFKQMAGSGAPESRMASPTGFEPVFWP